MDMKEAFEIGLLAILVRLQVVTAEDAIAIEKSFHDSDVDQFDDFLLREDIVDEEHLLVALSEYFQVPSFDAVGYFFERHYVRMFPKEKLTKNAIVPLEVDENIMIVVASRPNDPELLFEIGQYVSYDIQFYIGIGRDIVDAVREFYDKAETEVFDDGAEDIEDDLLVGEFHMLDEGGEEGIVFMLEDEDRFE